VVKVIGHGDSCEEDRNAIDADAGCIGFFIPAAATYSMA
jgi:hypothetical protein